MAYSIASYTGDGSNQLFGVTYPYIDKSHIMVYVDGIPVLFTWVNDSVVRTNTAPASGKTVLVKRNSSQALRLVDFQDGENLTEAILDLSALQCFYMAQEALDNGGGGGGSSADLLAAIAAAQGFANAAQNSATDAANSASSASASAAAAAASAAAAAAAAASINISNLWSTVLYNNVANTFRASIDPNAVFDLTGVAGPNTLAASFILNPTISPTVPAGKTMELFRFTGVYTLSGSTSIASLFDIGVQTDTAAPAGSQLYGVFSNVSNQAAANVYGVYAAAAITGSGSGPSYPLYVRGDSCSSAGSALAQLEAKGTNNTGIRILGTNTGSLQYGMYIANSVTVSSAAIRFESSSPANFLEHYDGLGNLFFKVDRFGSVTFGSTAQRIYGDLSNATRASRLSFQSSTVNGESRLGIIPNGTATASAINMFDAATPDNAGHLAVLIDATLASLRATKLGSGAFKPLGFYTSDLERLEIDVNGNVVLGTAGIATNATDGFFYGQSCAGTPTGAPTAKTGRVPQIYDSTNNKFYVYSGGSWHDVGGSVNAINQLTGDVTAGPGTGSQAATIAANAVTFAKMQNIATGVLLGRSTASTGNIETLSVGSGLTLSAGTLSAPARVVFLTPAYASTMTIDLSTYSAYNVVYVDVTLTGNVTFNITNGTDGQIIRCRIRQDGTGSRIWTNGANLRMSVDIPAITLTTTASKMDKLAFEWNGTDSKADILATNYGF